MNEELTITKRCSRCGEHKPTTKFHRRGTKLASSCLDCVSTYRKSYYQKQEKTHVLYVIVNPAWPEHCKLGRTGDIKARLKVYNTSTPFSDFRVHHVRPVRNYLEAERRVHEQLQAVRVGRSEWFNLLPTQAADIIDGLVE